MIVIMYFFLSKCLQAITREIIKQCIYGQSLKFFITKKFISCKRAYLMVLKVNTLFYMLENSFVTIDKMGKSHTKFNFL